MKCSIYKKTAKADIIIISLLGWELNEINNIYSINVYVAA